ncbi:hypothetical protein ACHQM5_002471 [Ranunculus cassubicifolius]
MDSQRKQRRSSLSFFYNSPSPKTEAVVKEKKVLSRIWNLWNPKVQNHQEIIGATAITIQEKEQVKELVAVEARKSVSHVETGLTSVASFLHVKVIAVDMPGYMQVHAFRCARRTYDTSENFSPKHMAYNIKKEFDQVYGPAWHCIVGSGFGSYVTYATGCFLYFKIEKIYILVFKTKVQKALD